jgi:hypothetical protein
MPVSDLDTLVPQNGASFFVLDVSQQNAWSITECRAHTFTIAGVKAQ